jgi:DNA polymerase-3 subunit gamma/tau
MYQVLARKYRPQTFGDLIGQEHVKATIENAITKNRIAHGYIFAGQRGTGKTTVARILARCLNCEQRPTPRPCGICSSCREVSAGGSPDVIEIDAASNRGINEMRELRESVRYRPSRDRFKVFIIDEAHQITNEAFNALLKTLEEPPEWVVFLLCTTETHKIPTTIASRCQQFSFRSVDFQQLVERMAWICEQEGIEAGPEALAVLAQAGGGSVRDSLSALDQAIAASGTRLDPAGVRGLLGMFSVESLERVTAALQAHDARALIEIVFELERNGQSMQHFVRELARYFRNLTVIRIGGADVRLIPASARELEQLTATAAGFSELDLTRYLQLSLDLFKDLQHSLQPRLHLELGLLRMLYASRLVEVEEALAALGPIPAATPVARAVAPAPAAARPAEKQAAPKPAAAPVAAGSGDLRNQMVKAAEDLGLTFTGDAIAHASVAETNGELVVAAPEEFLLSLGEKDLQRIAAKALGRAVKVKVVQGAGSEPAPARTAAANPQGGAWQRASEHPAVKKAQELFNGEIRNVRDLSE